MQALLDSGLLIEQKYALAYIHTYIHTSMYPFSQPSNHPPSHPPIPSTNPSIRHLTVGVSRCTCSAVWTKSRCRYSDPQYRRDSSASREETCLISALLACPLVCVVQEWHRQLQVVAHLQTSEIRTANKVIKEGSIAEIAHKLTLRPTDSRFSLQQASWRSAGKSRGFG